jgi:dolichyl-phosphate-mannose-protein mannosyltransferase
MFHAPARLRGATWVGWRRRGERLRTRPTTLVTVIVELVVGAALLTSVHEVDANVLRVVVVAVAVFILSARLAVGAATAGAAGSVALVLLSAIPMSTVVVTLGDARELRLTATLVALGFIPLAAGTVPALAFAHFDEARRTDVLPCLVTSAICGGAGVLGAIGAAGLVDIGDDRVAALIPYVAAGMAVLAMGEVLGHHRIGAGFPTSVAAIAATATAVWVLSLVDSGAGLGDAEPAITGAVIASAAATIGLLIATALATPRPLVVPVVDAEDGPRFAVWAVPVLAGLGLVLRIASMRPLWIDEVESPGVTSSSFNALTDAGRAGHSHPPLLDALIWLSRRTFGDDPWVLRLPSLIAGTLLIPVLYFTAAKLFDRRVGVVAAAIAAVGPGFVWLSNQAQPGALAALLTALSLLALTTALAENRVTDWLLFGLATALLLWAHQLAVLPVGILLGVAAATMWRRRAMPTPRRARRWLLAVVINIAALVALLVYRHGFGPSDVLPPVEYATDGAPGAGRSVFGLTGIALTGVVGFHRPAVTSRLLALWPLCMLASFVLLGRSWSRRGAVVAALAVGPFLVLILLQVAGAPRNPPFALTWTATAMPMVAIGAAYAIGHAGRWRYARSLGVAVLVVLLVASLDQRSRLDPLPKYDISAAIDEVAAAGPGDVVIYAPADIGELVRYRVAGARVMSASDAADDQHFTAGGGRGASHVYIVGAFAWRPTDPTLERALDLVTELSSERHLAAESGSEEVKVWTFD